MLEWEFGSEAEWLKLLPSVEDSFREDLMHQFFGMMYERQQIWVRRSVLKQKFPWTDDPILRDHKFTNVYRELDRSSQWEIQHIISDHSLGLKDLVWKILVFRTFNKPELFDFAQGIPAYEGFDFEEFFNTVEAFRATGQNPFTSAYYINNTACPGQSRDWCYCYHALPKLHAALPKIVKMILTNEHPTKLVAEFVKLPCIGKFLAHEFYISLTYAARYWRKPIFRWDENSWTNVGPGASLGIRLIFPSLATTKEQENAIYWLRDIAPNYIHKHFIGFEFLKWNEKIRKYYLARSGCNLTLHQIEMCLCEFSKYWKMQIGQGKQRSRFHPRD